MNNCFRVHTPLGCVLPELALLPRVIGFLRTLVALFCMKCVCAEFLSHVELCDPIDCSPLGSLFMEFSRQEYLSGLTFPTPGSSLSHFPIVKTPFILSSTTYCFYQNVFAILGKSPEFSSWVFCVFLGTSRIQLHKSLCTF